MPRDSKARLADIVEATERIESYVSGLTPELFRSDRKTVDAVVRNLEIVGEAVKSLPTEIRERQPQIPWSRIAGLRDLLIHEYFGVDTEILWQIAIEKAPELNLAVRQILFDLDAADSGLAGH